MSLNLDSFKYTPITNSDWMHVTWALKDPNIIGTTKYFGGPLWGLSSQSKDATLFMLSLPFFYIPFLYK